MNFKEFLHESLDSSFEILKVEKGDFGVDLYYLDMNKEYRVFIEEVNKDLHLGFERKINGKWDIIPITNDLNTKEILGLFGTIKNILLKRNFKSLYIETDNGKKHQLYHNLMVKLNRTLKFEHLARDEKSIVLYGGEYLPEVENFKYKK